MPIPRMAEYSKAELMMMEKETTGMYISGHPMDDYRAMLKGSYVVPIGQLMGEESGFKDEQIVSVAGIVHSGPGCGGLRALNAAPLAGAGAD